MSDTNWKSVEHKLADALDVLVAVRAENEALKQRLSVLQDRVDSQAEWIAELNDRVFVKG
jgi:BMFP domain-containing protein YqiC